MVAAWAANGLTSCEDSAMSRTLTKASTRIVPQMNRVGPSTATAPTATMCPGLPLANSDEPTAMTMTSTNAEADLAELVISAFPHMQKVRFVSSGTEATMSAI